MVFVRRRASCGVRFALTILNFNFPKMTRPFLTIFCVKHLSGKRNLSKLLRLWLYHSQGATDRAKCGKGQIFKKFLSYSHTYWAKTECMVMMPMKPSTKTMKFIGPESEVQPVKWGQFSNFNTSCMW